jgi:hypothetical protein
MPEPDGLLNVAIVGAGAAGLATAIFAARKNPAIAIAVLDGAKKPGAKILVSGGGRCNVTNTVVMASDFRGVSSNIVRRILDRFTADQAVAFFREIGVSLHVEPGGKFFPHSNSARTVLDALLKEVERRGIRLLTDHRVTTIDRENDLFRLSTSGGPLLARRVVLATGGLSLPKTGSDGAGYRIATSLDHTVVPTTPALAPLLLKEGFHVELSGISHPVELTLRVEGEKPVRVAGPMLWTHFGVSGPAALDASRFWHRAEIEKRPVAMTANLLPGEDLASIEKKMLALARSHPTTHLRNLLSTLVPAQLATTVLKRLGLEGATPMAHLRQEDRRRLLRAMVDWPMAVSGSRGYNYAEVTAGGVPLSEVDPATLVSRRSPGLYFAGEILDVDGRLGGFNFQWAWSSAWVVASALATLLQGHDRDDA